MAERRLTGVWSGLYSYPMAQGPVAFTATLVDWGGGFSGACEERAADQWGRMARRRSTLSGTAADRAVTFLKAYAGGAWTHGVSYAGTLSADATEVEGTWSIPGNWSGRFLMVRGERVDERELSRAFAEV